LMVLNAGVNELKSWQVFVRFQHDEILVLASSAVLVDADDLPTKVGNKGGDLRRGFYSDEGECKVEGDEVWLKEGKL
ncbi:hypothetical protein U1Q18_001259, partial [Sarracenia purpurea var. burkii]